MKKLYDAILCLLWLLFFMITFWIVVNISLGKDWHFKLSGKWICEEKMPRMASIAGAGGEECIRGHYEE